MQHRLAGLGSTVISSGGKFCLSARLAVTMPRLARFSIPCALLISVGSRSCLGFSDANWTSLGTGMNDHVEALVASGSNVFAGGRFSIAGGVSVGCIAKWDGQTWSRLGAGLNGYAYALAVSGTNLYVGGRFTTAGGISANNIAKWNGSSWSALGSGIGESPYYISYVYAVAVVGSNVFVGGSFSRAGFSTVDNIAMWNGSSWSAAGTLSGVGLYAAREVHSLAAAGDTLYMGGEFGRVNSIVVNRIAKREGNYWAALGIGTEGGDGSSVYALAVSGSTVYVGGNLQSVGPTGSNLGRWDGNNWIGLGGISATNYRPSTKALALAGDDLYVGGDFRNVGGSGTNRISASRVAKWNGTAWSALGSGMNESVEAFTVSGNELFAGGRFTTAGGKPAMYIARAYLPDLPSLSIIGTHTNVMVSWPSPNTAGFTLEETTNLAGPRKWVTNSAPVIDDGTRKVVSVSTTNDPKLFRLRGP